MTFFLLWFFGNSSTFTQLQQEEWPSLLCLQFRGMAPLGLLSFPSAFSRRLKWWMWEDFSLPYSHLSIVFCLYWSFLYSSLVSRGRKYQGEADTFIAQGIPFGSGWNFSLATSHLSWDHKISVQGKICHKPHSEVTL